MRQIELIGRSQDSTHSKKLATFAYDSNLVIDIDKKLCWIRNAAILNMRVTYNSAVKLIKEMNRSACLGFSDWRLPTQDELMQMVSYALDAGWGDADGHRVSDYFNNLVFKKIRPDLYWSCTLSQSKWIYGVSMSIGRETYTRANHDAYVWPVRGGKHGYIELCEIHDEINSVPLNADYSAYQAECNRHNLLKERMPRHHYFFVHRVLRDCCQHSPVEFFTGIDKNCKSELVEIMWKITCDECDPDARSYFRLDDISFHLLRISGFPAVLTIMPYPHIINEAYMTISVLLIPLDEINWQELDEEAPVAFITLERSIWNDGTEVAVLCGWDGDDHLNFGKFIKPEPDLFLAAAKVLIRKAKRKGRLTK